MQYGCLVSATTWQEKLITLKLTFSNLLNNCSNSSLQLAISLTGPICSLGRLLCNSGGKDVNTFFSRSVQAFYILLCLYSSHFKWITGSTLAIHSSLLVLHNINFGQRSYRRFERGIFHDESSTFFSLFSVFNCSFPFFQLLFLESASA